MQLIEPTPFPAQILRAQLHYRDLVLATLVAKASYQVDANGTATPAGEPLGINEGDVETPLGVLENDLVPIKQGCDFAVYGPAVSPKGLAEKMLVTIKIGNFARTLQVTGDRAWLPRTFGVSVSRTALFQTMSLDYSRAFGGKAIHPSGIETTEPNNPLGRGWCLSAKLAPGIRLPNLEEVDQPMTSWDQTPLPASLLPLPRTSALRGTRGINVDLERQKTTFTPLAFVSSHPRMHLPAFPAGAPVSVTGMSSSPWQCRLPSLNLAAEIMLGQRKHQLQLIPDTLCLVPDQRRLWVVARRAFLYQFIPERLRHVRLFVSDTPPLDSSTTIITNELAAKPTAISIESPDLPENMPIPWDMLREMHPLTQIIESLPLLASG